MADGKPVKRPARKAPAKKASARKTPAKKAPRKRAAPKRKTAAQRKIEEQERALQWSVAHSSPLAILDGWHPDTGVWAATSPIGQVLDRISRGAHVSTAAKSVHLRQLPEIVMKGREYLADTSLSQDRMLVPIELRPFIDLAQLVDAAEANTEISATEKVYAAIDDDPRLGMTFLARRFPERWAEQQQMFAHVEYDPRDRAVAELLDDPNVALQLASFARQAETNAAEYDQQDL